VVSAERVGFRLQIENAAARLITGTQKHERGLSRLLRDDLHWLTFPQRVQYKLAVTVHRCLQYRAPKYLACQSLKFPAANISVRPTVGNLIFRGFVAVLVALWLSESPVRQFGTHYLIRCAIQPSSLNVLGGTWKHNTCVVTCVVTKTGMAKAVAGH